MMSLSTGMECSLMKYKVVIEVVVDDPTNKHHLSGTAKMVIERILTEDFGQYLTVVDATVEEDE